MEKEIGTVISGLESPSPSALDFVVSSGFVHRGQFVELDYSEGTMICLVTDVYKTNRYFERAESVKEFESAGAKLFEQFPTAEWEYLVAKTRPLGVFREGITRRATLPPGPGTRVRIASNENLKKFFHFSEEGLFLGTVENHDLPVKISMSNLLKKHLAILALSGAGKSYLVSVLFEELLERKKDSGRIATIVFDPHGEYSSFAERSIEKGKQDYSNKTIFVKASDIRIGVPKLSVNTLDSIIPGLSSIMRRDLGKILSDLQHKMRTGKGPFDLIDLKEAISKQEMNENTRNALLAWISELNELGLFAKTDNPSVFDFAQPGKLTVIDLSELIDLRKKQIIVSYIARRLFYARRDKNVPPFLLVLEEAHQFCLSEDTEILTPFGWKEYNQIKTGDMAFSYNKNKNKLLPQKIERIIVREHKGGIIKLTNEDSIDSLATPDHRVLCNYRTTGKNRKWKWSELDFVSAEKLPSGARIPVACKIEPKSKCEIDNNLIKILGWIITDGNIHFTHNKKSFSYVISQSKSKGKIFEEIKKVTKLRFPESTVYDRHRKGSFYNSEFIRGTHEFRFYLGKKANDEIFPWLAKVPHRIPRNFLGNASQEQLKLLFDALVQGDGTIQITKNKHKYVVFYAGKNLELADEFQELCFRLGFSAVIKKAPSNQQIKVLVSFKRKFAYVRKIKKEHFSGKVWDITIKNSAFVARRNGKIFITGNCPQQSSEETAISRGIIQTIAREGRKFGASLCLISQRPIQLSTTVLAQCNSQIILRITNPYDLKHIGESAEGLDSRSLDMITSLRVGEALIVGEATHYPLFFKVRERKSPESRHEIPLEKAALEFENRKEEKSAEAEEFL